MILDLDGFLLHIRDRAVAASPQRLMIGVAGAPGAGKSTATAQLTEALGSVAQVIPMDGFHLAQEELARIGRAERKGAIDTFDVTGFVHLLTRVRRDDSTVYAPRFDRRIEEPIAGSIPISPEHRIVIVEGNYLLCEGGGWADVARVLDECWYLDLDTAERRRRLVQRRRSFGDDAGAASAWVDGVDEPNARRIEETRGRATGIIRLEEQDI